MSKTIGTYGGLCNQVIRNLALSLVAKKHNLYVDYFNYDLINNNLGISLFVGENKFDTTKSVNDDNYMEVLNSNNIDYNLDFNRHFFQSEGIINILYERLRSDEQRFNIIKHNPFGNRYNNNNDLFIHIRLKDLSSHNPGIDYYLAVIKKIQFDKLYVSSDSPYHPILGTIKTKYPEAILMWESPIRVIQFGSTCKHVALTFGSFSAIIGYLSFFSNVYYTDIDRPVGAGPISLFTDKGWTPVSF